MQQLKQLGLVDITFKLVDLQNIGTYDAEKASAPAYKNKPNAGFVSNSTRSFDAHVKQKLGYSKFNSRTPVSAHSDNGRRVSAAETAAEEDDEEEYIKVSFYWVSSGLKCLGRNSRTWPLL